MAEKISRHKISRNLADLSGPEVEKHISPSSIFIQPLGATEQHGPHLPLSVDYVIASETSKALVAAKGDELDLWLLPALPVTKSNEHAWSKGTLWLSAQTLLAVLDDIASCVAKTGAESLVFLNAHGGNSSLLNVACRDIRLKHNLKTFLVHPFVPADQGGTVKNVKEAKDAKGKSDEEKMDFDIHGGHKETSMMLYLRPELVNMDLAVPNIPEGMKDNDSVRFGGKVTFGWQSNDFGQAGLIGDPTGANPEQGKEYFEAVIKSLGSQLKEIAEFNFGQ